MSRGRGFALACTLPLAVCSLACEAGVTNIGAWTESGHYLEAEAGTLAGGFEIGNDGRASGGRFLSAPRVKSDDAPGEARAEYPFTVRTAGSYKIWGRIRSPDAEHNRFWVRVDNGDWMKWRISVGDVWYWDAFHDDVDYGNAREYPLQAGEHVLTLANCAAEVELDRLYYSSVPEDRPPGNDTACEPPHSIEIGGICQLSCGRQGGNQCGAPCKGYPSLTAYDCEGACCYIAP